MGRFRQWRLARVRAISWGNSYIRFTPNFGFGVPWFGGRRLRYARHHGLQIVCWRGERWAVQRQVLGHSTVKGEKYAAVR